MDPRGTVGRIYKEDLYTLLLTKYESSGPCGFGEEDFFYVFPIVSLWELMTPNHIGSEPPLPSNMPVLWRMNASCSRSVGV